jgi:hypothetical protein
MPVGEGTAAAADTWSPPQHLSRAGRTTTSPTVSSNSAGQAVAVWLRAVVNDPTDPAPCDILDVCVVEAARFDPATETWGPSIQLSASGENAAEADVLVDQNGRALAVWRRTSKGTIEASIFDGRAWDSTPERVSAEEGGSRGPQLTAGPNGSFTVAWYNPQNEVNVIVASRYAAGKWSDGTIVARELNAVVSSVAADGTGGVMAIWRAQLDPNGPLVIRASRYTTSWSEPVTVSAATPTEADRAQVAVDPAGNAIAVWQQSNGENVVIRSSRYDVVTRAWSVPQDLSVGGSNAVNPRAASDTAGNITVLWRRTNDSGFSTVQTTRFVASDGTWDPVSTLSSGTRQSQSHQLAVDASGQVTAVWRIADPVEPAPDPAITEPADEPEANWIVQAARYSPAVDEWGAALDLSPPEPEAMAPATDVDAAGNVIVVWASDDLIQASRSKSVPGFVAVSPVRVFDTRPDQSPNALRAVDKRKVGGAVELSVQMTALPGGATPAAGVGAVSLNVTVVDADQAGYVTVYPCANRSEVSNVNFMSRQVVANAVITPVAADGRLCFFSNTPVHIVADLNGYFPAGSGFNAVGPMRVFDTRPASSPDALRTVPKSPIGGDVELRVPMTGLPSGATPTSGISAVALNVTVANGAGNGFVTVYPCGERELVSSVNFVAGRAVSNSVIAPLSATGELCFFSNVSADIVVDIAGWFATKSSYIAAESPARAFDTRSKVSPDALLDVPKGRMGGGSVIRVRLTDLPGITPPVGVEAVSLNVTVDGSTQDGFVTVYPCDEPKEVSSVNFAGGQTVANAVIAPLSEDGDLCFMSNVQTHLIADINGYFTISN